MSLLILARLAKLDAAAKARQFPEVKKIYACSQLRSEKTRCRSDKYSLTEKCIFAARSLPSVASGKAPAEEARRGSRGGKAACARRSAVRRPQTSASTLRVIKYS